MPKIKIRECTTEFHAIGTGFFGGINKINRIQAFAGNPDLETVTLTQYIYNEIKKVHGSVENVFGSQVLVYQDYKGNPLKN